MEEMNVMREMPLALKLSIGAFFAVGILGVSLNQGVIAYFNNLNSGIIQQYLSLATTMFQQIMQENPKLSFKACVMIGTIALLVFSQCRFALLPKDNGSKV
jgi:hypothetical protein